jgi:hopanoid biosynthesis associated protein HpnK
VKRLIVNADDFGLTRGVNRAIAECHQRGVVTSTTLMANSDEFQDAVESVKRLVPHANGPALGVGCHIVLADGGPVLPPSQVPSLLAPGTGLFYQSIQQLAKQALGNRFRSEEIEAEATAQFQKIQAAGIRISHFDAHKHAHMFPSILKPLLRAAAACGVPALRNPFEPVFSMPIPSLLRIPVRYAEVLALRAFRAKFHAMVAESGLHTTDGSLGLIATGTLTVSKLSALLDRMQDGLWELVSHPGYNDAQLATISTRLRASRETEMQALTAESTRRALERNGIQLISFQELSGEARRLQADGFESPGGCCSSNMAKKPDRGACS